MYRSMFQCYVKNSIEAVETYKRAFNAREICAYPNEDGNGYMHCELDVYGQCLAVTENFGDENIGASMQFCLHFGEGGEEQVKLAAEVLRKGARQFDAVDADWSPLCYSLTDKYGVMWCIFV